MNKSQLKEIIQNVVAHKLAEAKGEAPKYGYIISGKRSEDPALQLIGYGNMPKSLWKKKIEKYAEELLARVKREDWSTAAYFMEKNSVFNSAVNMMKEIYDKDLNELENQMSSLKQQTAQKELEAAKKKEEDALKKKREIDKKKADFEKRNYPIVNKNQRAGTAADINVGKASKDVADKKADLAKIISKASM